MATSEIYCTLYDQIISIEEHNWRHLQVPSLHLCQFDDLISYVELLLMLSLLRFVEIMYEMRTD